jgi:hypothetical protein
MKNDKTKATLIRAKELLSKPGAWIQNYSSKDDQGNSVPFTNDTACKFCLSGAIERAVIEVNGGMSYLSTAQCRSAVENANDNIKARGIVSFNDTHGRSKKEIIEVLDTAIQQFD